jgi:hypothetical protein
MAARTQTGRRRKPAAPPGTPIAGAKKTTTPSGADAKAPAAAPPAPAVEGDLDTDVREPVLPPAAQIAPAPTIDDIEHADACPRKGRRYETYRLPDAHARETTVTRCVQCGRTAAATTAHRFLEES